MHVRQDSVIDPDSPPGTPHRAPPEQHGWLRGAGRVCARTAPVALLVLLGGCASGHVAPALPSALPSPVPSAASAPAPRIEAAQAMRMGESLRTAGDPTGAAVFFRRAHTLAPDDPAPLLGMADAAAATGRHDEAADLFRQTLALDPGNVAARLGYGRTLLAMSRPGPARAELRAALDADPADPRAALALGVAAELDGDPDAARAVYREALRLNPDNVLLRNNLALSLAIAGDSGQAIALLDELAGTLEGGSRVRQNLALANALAGHDDQARAIAAQDLDGPTLANRLAFFRSLRGLDGPRLAQAVMCNCTARTPGAPADAANPDLVSDDALALAPAQTLAGLRTTHLASPTTALAVAEGIRQPLGEEGYARAGASTR